MLAGKDFLSMSDLNSGDIQSLMELAAKLKSDSKHGMLQPRLQKKVVGLMFEKPSTRTRASFETAVYQLGGGAMYLRADEMQLSRGEPLKDTARILGGYLNGIVMRTYAHQNLVEFAKFAPVPVINALSDLEHPTQIIADMLTILEAKGNLSGLKFVWIGDGNNVCHSWLLGGTQLGMNLVISCPQGYEPDKHVLGKSREYAEASGGSVKLVRNPSQAAEGADVLYTDVWVSMGQEKEVKKKERTFRPYQINEKLVSKANPDVSVMHCLPAHRGKEITNEELEGSHSIVWQQAENKLHGARAVLAGFLGDV